MDVIKICYSCIEKIYFRRDLNMKRTIRNITLYLLALALLLCAVSCGSVSAIKSTDEEALVVAMCGEHEVRYEELRYIVVACKEEMKARYGEDIFSSEESAALYEDELYQNVSNSLRQSYAILDAALERGIKANSSAVKKDVREYVDETAAILGGVDAYKTYLTSVCMTDSVFRLYASIVSCQYRLFDVLAPQIEKESYDAVLAREGFVHTLSIFIKHDAGEDWEENRAIAENIRAKIAEGKTLESFVGSKYNQDTSSCEYYFVEGYMDEAYEAAAFALEMDEISDVVEVRDGFYIIKRLPLEDAYVENYMDELMQIYQIATMNRIFAEKQESLALVLNEEGKKLSLTAME